LRDFFKKKFLFFKKIFHFINILLEMFSSEGLTTILKAEFKDLMRQEKVNITQAKLSSAT